MRAKNDFVTKISIKASMIIIAKRYIDFGLRDVVYLKVIKLNKTKDWIMLMLQKPGFLAQEMQT